MLTQPLLADQRGLPQPGWTAINIRGCLAASNEPPALVPHVPSLDARTLLDCGHDPSATPIQEEACSPGISSNFHAQLSCSAPSARLRACPPAHSPRLISTRARICD